MNKKIGITLVATFLLVLAIASIVTSTNTTTQFSVERLHVKNIDDGWISVDITTSGNGTFGVDIDNKQVWTETVNNNTVGAGNQFQLTQGKHNICTYVLNNKQNTIMCATTNN